MSASPTEHVARSTPPRSRLRLRLRCALAVATVAILSACTTAPPAPVEPLTSVGSEPLTSVPSPRASTPAQTNSPAPPARSIPITSSSLPDQPSAPRGPDPVAVEVPRLAARADVEPVGVADDGQMEIPAFAETAGWYRFGARPGEPQGTVVIAAHVDSIASAGLGPFAALRDAEPGDEIVVTLEDGSTETFHVEEVDRRGKQGIDWEEVFVRDGEPRLVLITCGGRFLRDVGHYEDNLLVWAVPRGARR